MSTRVHFGRQSPYMPNATSLAFRPLETCFQAIFAEVSASSFLYSTSSVSPLSLDTSTFLQSPQNRSKVRGGLQI